MNAANCKSNRGVVVAALLGIPHTMTASVDIDVSGRVVDLNGAALAQGMVSLETASSHAGPDVITAFSDVDGRFRFPEPVGRRKTLQRLSRDGASLAGPPPGDRGPSRRRCKQAPES